MQQLATTKEIANRYRVTAVTIRAWARRGWIPCIRAGRRPLLFDPSQVDLALRSRGSREGGHE